LIVSLGPFGWLPLGSLPPGSDASVPNPVAALLDDATGRKTILLRARPYDPVGAQIVDVLISNDGYASGATDTWPDGTSQPHQKFRARLGKPAYSIESGVLSGGEITDGSVPAFGEQNVINTDGELNDHLGYVWEGASLETYLGAPSWPLQDFALIGKGSCAGIEPSLLGYTIRFRDPAYRLKRRNMHTQRYRGHDTCLRFDGVDDRATGGNNLNQTGSCTFEIWAWPETAGSFGRLFSKDDGVTGWTIFVDSDDIFFFIRGGTLVSTSGDRLTRSQWNHIAVVLDVVADTVTFYVNGEQVGQTTSYTTVPATNTHTFSIGARHDGASPFKGRLDEPRVWTGVARSAQEIRDNYLLQLPSQANLSYWSFDDATGATAFGDSGAVNLTITGARWVDSLTGGKELAGQAVPTIWGRVLKYQPVLVGRLGNVYQVHDDDFEEVTTLEDGGVVSWTSAGDFTDPDDATLTAGQYCTSKARGLIRLGSAPVRTLTANLKGDNTGGYVEDGAQLVRRIATGRGGLTDPDEIDLASFAAMVTTNSAPLGYATRLDTESVDEVIVTIMRTLYGWRTFTRQGLLAVGRLDEPGTPRFTLGRKTLRKLSLRRINTSPASKAWKLGYARYYQTLNPEGLATSLTQQEKLDRGQSYRYVTTPEDASVVAADTDAEVLEEDTLFALEADALAEAIRRQAITGVPRYTYEAPQTIGLYQYAINDDAELEVNLHAHSGNWPCTIVRYSERVPDAVALEVWG